MAETMIVGDTGVHPLVFCKIKPTIESFSSPTLRVCSRKRISSEPPCHELDHSGLNEGEACC